MNKSQVEVSVIIPVYGDAPHLKSTITSVESQEYQNFELILILDRPSADIDSYSRELENHSDRVRVLNSKNPGISDALNLGINESSGQFLARLDSDDLMRADRLKLQVKFLEKHPEVVCIGSQVMKINVLGQPIGHSTFPTRARQISETLLFRNCIAHPSVMYRKSAIVRAGGYRSEYNGAEDYDLWLRLLNFGQIVNLNEELTLYRVWENQITSGKKQEIAIVATNVRSSYHNSLKFEENSKPPYTKNRIKKDDLRANWYDSSRHFNQGVNDYIEEKKRIKALLEMCLGFRSAPILLSKVVFGFLYRNLSNIFWKL